MGRAMSAENADLAFACACGTVSGVIRQAGPREGDHVVCHCRDCRRFATRFDAGNRVLDDHGGTALYQSRCARVFFHAGREKLGCLHLTDKPTLRWYARCCDTPMFNTYATGRIPYVTTILGNCDGARVADLLGRPIGHLFTAEAPVHPGGVPEMSMTRLMRRFLGRMARDIVSGDRRRSPLFDPKTLLPIAEPVRVAASVP